jgi:hypothetical protein
VVDVRMGAAGHSFAPDAKKGGTLFDEEGVLRHGLVDGVAGRAGLVSYCA